MNHSIQRALVERDVYARRRDGGHVAHVADLPFYLRFVGVAGLHQGDYDGGEVDAELGCVAADEQVVWYCLGIKLGVGWEG
jgi:hypothetical protein